MSVLFTVKIRNNRPLFEVCKNLKSLFLFIRFFVPSDRYLISRMETNSINNYVIFNMKCSLQTLLSDEA